MSRDSKILRWIQKFESHGNKDSAEGIRRLKNIHVTRFQDLRMDSEVWISWKQGFCLVEKYRRMSKNSRLRRFFRTVNCCFLGEISQTLMDLRSPKSLNLANIRQHIPDSKSVWQTDGNTCTAPNNPSSKVFVCLFVRDNSRTIRLLYRERYPFASEGALN